MLDGDAPFHDDRYRFGGLTLVGVLVSDQPLEKKVGARGAVMTSRNSNGVWDAWQLLRAPKGSLHNDGGFHRKLSREALEPVLPAPAERRQI